MISKEERDRLRALARAAEYSRDAGQRLRMVVSVTGIEVKRGRRAEWEALAEEPPR